VVSELAYPHGLAFDAAGNLWVGYFGPNTIARYTPDELATGGDVRPGVQIVTDVMALIESLAFDEAGNLWFTYSEGSVAMYSPADLGSSGRKAPTRVLYGDALRLAVGLAFNPTPEGSPNR
jgi:sugar lactone lactonase YvrE